MSWQPPERPEWVRAINAGLVPVIADEADLPLERDALLGEARARAGIPDGGVDDFCFDAFDADALVEPLDRLLEALEREAALHRMGRWMARRHLLRLLEVRLQLKAYVRDDPGVRDEPIERPLFVAGAPRTGTTILFDLLASDPALRAPLGWELLRPLPPPDADPSARSRDPRVALADRELVLPQTVVSGLRAIHVFGGSRPKECISAMALSFLSEEFTGRYRTPSYASWLDTCDMTPAYRMHRLVLQVLQRRTGPSAWVLKSPVHLRSLPTLFSVYPDARVAVTHRDPLTVLASLTSLIATLRWSHSDAVDAAEIGATHARHYRRVFADLVAWTEEEVLPEAQLHHSRHADFRSDALGVLRGLYARFGLAFDEGRAAKAVGNHAESERGSHDYSFDATGLDAGAERDHHAAYQSLFSVPSEAGAGRPEDHSHG